MKIIGSSADPIPDGADATGPVIIVTRAPDIVPKHPCRRAGQTKATLAEILDQRQQIDAPDTLGKPAMGKGRAHETPPASSALARESVISYENAVAATLSK